MVNSSSTASTSTRQRSNSPTSTNVQLNNALRAHGENPDNIILRGRRGLLSLTNPHNPDASGVHRATTFRVRQVITQSAEINKFQNQCVDLIRAIHNQFITHKELIAQISGVRPKFQPSYLNTLTELFPQTKSIDQSTKEKNLTTPNKTKKSKKAKKNGAAVMQERSCAQAIKTKPFKITFAAFEKMTAHILKLIAPEMLEPWKTIEMSEEFLTTSIIFIMDEKFLELPNELKEKLITEEQETLITLRTHFQELNTWIGESIYGQTIQQSGEANSFAEHVKNQRRIKKENQAQMIFSTPESLILEMLGEIDNLTIENTDPS